MRCANYQVAGTMIAAYNRALQDVYLHMTSKFTLNSSALFDQDCMRCTRLALFLAQIRSEYPHYHARPVAPFGAEDARLLIVGLAPGMHGANASGRPFTGDFAGILLYETLYQFRWSNQPQARARDDGLQLQDCRITNAVKCLPPENKPTGAEIATCNRFLKNELTTLAKGGVILALGGIAHRAVLRSLALKAKAYPFAHGRVHGLDQSRWLIDSYHCSRYNTQTKRLNKEMFQAVFRRVDELLGRAAL